MQKLEIKGGKKISGTIEISGSKNASLPILAATLLSNKKVYLNNLPKVKDIETMINLLKSLGSITKFNKNSLNSVYTKWHKTCKCIYYYEEYYFYFISNCLGFGCFG